MSFATRVDRAAQSVLCRRRFTIGGDLWYARATAACAIAGSSALFCGAMARPRKRSGEPVPRKSGRRRGGPPDQGPWDEFHLEDHARATTDRRRSDDLGTVRADRWRLGIE